MKDWLLCVHVVVKTFNLDISRPLSFGRLRQRIVLKCVPHVRHDYFSIFNQSHRCFLAVPLYPDAVLKDEKSAKFVFASNYIPWCKWNQRGCHMIISFRWIGQVFWNRGKMAALTFQVNYRREWQLRFSKAISRFTRPESAKTPTRHHSFFRN